MTDTARSAQSKDFTIPGGCMLCGGDLPVRVTAAGAKSVCKKCGWFATPDVRMTHDGFQVAYRAEGRA